MLKIKELYVKKSERDYIQARNEMSNRWLFIISDKRVGSGQRVEPIE